MGEMLGWAHSKARIWAWVVAELVSLPALLHPQHQGELSRTALASSSNAAAGKEAEPALSFSCPQGLLSHIYATSFSSIVLPRRGAESTLPRAAAVEGQGQLSHFYALRANSRAPTPPEPASPCWPGKVRGLLSRVLQLARDGTTSLVPKTLEPVLLTTASGG